MPILVKLPVPVMAPEKVELVAVPSVKVMPVNPKVPDPLKLPSVWLTVVISTVPALMVKAPKLFEPDKVSVPALIFVKSPVPVIVPDNVELRPLVSKVPLLEVKTIFFDEVIPA